MLAQLRRICATGALLEVVAGLDPERDQAEIERLKLPGLSLSHIDTVLAPRYRAAGFAVVRRGILPPGSVARLDSTWARRVGRWRTVYYFIARAV
jgi:hypothetical protein